VPKAVVKQVCYVDQWYSWKVPEAFGMPSIPQAFLISESLLFLYLTRPNSFSEVVLGFKQSLDS